jgi:hypothetical protein
MLIISGIFNVPGESCIKSKMTIFGMRQHAFSEDISEERLASIFRVKTLVTSVNTYKTI